MGNVEELEKLWETLPKQMFTDIFIRPINVVEMVENIKRQMDHPLWDFYIFPAYHKHEGTEITIIPCPGGFDKCFFVNFS